MSLVRERFSLRSPSLPTREGGIGLGLELGIVFGMVMLVVVGTDTIGVGDAGIAGVDPLALSLSLSLFAKPKLGPEGFGVVIVVVVGEEGAGGEDMGNVDDGVFIERGYGEVHRSHLAHAQTRSPSFSSSLSQACPTPPSSRFFLSLSLILASAFALPFSRF